MLNELPKAHALVSNMILMEGLRLAEVFDDNQRDEAATEALALTSRFQISRDLVEEWLAWGSPPLSSGTRFIGV